MRNHHATSFLGCVLFGGSLCLTASLCLGCKKESPKQVEGDIGVPPCDAYLAKAEKCLGGLASTQKDAAAAGFKAQRNAWRTLANNPSTKNNLAAQCAQAAEELKKQCP